jgi:tetratricopeptide (TPR) repeat protein
MNLAGKIVFTFCFIFILLHIWGAANPSHINWGFQSFAYYDIVTSVIVLILIVTLFIPSILRFWMRTLGQVTEIFSALPKIVVFLGCAAILIFLSLQFPSRGLLLGDSKLILLTTNELPENPLVSANFRNQPLVLTSLHGMESMLAFIGIHGIKNIYIWMDIIAGIIFLGIVYLFLLNEKMSNIEKVFAGLFIFAGGGSQFFFGYIENYALLYAFTAGYIVTALLALQKRIHVIIPVILFLGIAGLHLGALIFFPSIILLLILSWQNNKRTVIVLTTLLPVLLLFLVYLSNYGMYQFIVRIQTAFSHDFLPFVKPIPGVPYTVFSLIHLVEWINLNFIIVPLGLIPVIIILIANRRKIWQNNKELLFLLTTAVCGLIFTFIMTPALGMFRDWDLMASFFIPLIFLSLYLITYYFSGNVRKQLIAVIALISITHTAFRIGVNADEDRHVRHAETMAQPSLLSTFAQQLFYDRLANVFWERKDYAKTKFWYERYLTIDSTNPRIIANLSDAYKKLNETENMFRMLRRSAELGTKNPGVYINLGVEYYRHGDIQNAIRVMEQGLKIDPKQPICHANLGLYYLQLDKYEQAADHFENSLRFGMRDPIVIKHAGNARFALHNYAKAMEHYNNYFRINPSDSLVKEKITKLKGMLSSNTPKSKKIK